MKKKLFFCFVFLSITQFNFSQGTNPQPTGAETQTFCKTENKTVGDLAVSAGDIVWYNQETGGIAYDNLAALITGFYYADDETGGDSSSARLKVEVFVNGEKPNTNVSISECARDNPTIANLFAIGAVGSTIEWFADEVGGSPLGMDFPIQDGVRYWAQQTDNGCVSERSDTYVRLITTPAPIVDVSQQTQTFCQISKSRVSDLKATLNKSSSTLLWYSSIDSTEPLDPTELLVDGNDYYAAEIEVEALCESTDRAKVIVSITVVPAPTTISSNQSFCEIDAKTIADLNITGTDVKWYASLTSTAVLDTTDVLVNNTDYYATQTIGGAMGCESSERTLVSVTVNNTNAPTVTNGTPSFCKIDKATIGDIDITGSGIKWYASLTSTTVLDPTVELLDGTDYYATQTDETTGCESIDRIMVSVTVNSVSAPTVANANPSFCKIDALTIADIDITGTNIKWYASLTSTTVLDTTQLLESTDYYATQTDDSAGCESSERTKVSVTVNTIEAPTVVNDSPSFCELDGLTIADLDITGTGIKWYASLTSTTVLDPTEVLQNSTDYYATQTDATTGCESSERTLVSVTVNTTTAPTTVNATPSFCKIDALTIADLDITGTDIKWYASLTSTTVLDATEVLQNSTEYYATQTDSVTGCESKERTLVTVTIVNTEAPIANETVQNFCKIDAATVADLNVTGTGIKWYASLTSTTVLNAADILVNNTDYYATQTDDSESCESEERTKVTVIITNTDAPTTINITQVFCESDAPTLADLDLVGTNIKWYETLSSTTALDNTMALEEGKSYFATQTNTVGCESDVRLSITVSLTKADVPTLALNGEEFCVLKGDFMLSDLNDRISVSDGNSIIWYDSFPNGNELSLSEILVHNTKYYAISEDADGCKSMEALEVVINLEACEDKDLVLYDGFSPNNDGINDVFTIKNIELLYPGYTIDFYNRWGNVVYEGKASKPYWNGELNGNGELLPKGIYFYILDFRKNNKKPKQGKLYLSR
jgi:gliding motility-associated-like protein